MKLFAVKDMKTQHFLQPNCQKSVPDALRSWQIVATEGDSVFRKFPHDFRLFHLADIDINTGRVSPLEDPVDYGSIADVTPPEQTKPTDLFAKAN